MKTKRKIGSVGLAAATLASVLLFAVAPAAMAVTQPKISKIKDKTKTGFVVVAKLTDLEKKKVKIQVEIKLDKTGKLVKRFTESKTVKKNGQSSLKVIGLKSKTKYRVRIRVMRKSGGDWSQYSASKKTTTL